jgi:group I intron endonuclease
MVIYKTTNLVNGKFYIGKDAKNKKSYLGSGKVLKHAIQKYGKDNFKKEILETCNTLEELSEREKYWIKELKAIENGYNLAEGGVGGNTHGDIHHPNWGWKSGNTPWNKGVPTNEKTKKKISQSRRGKMMGGNQSSYKPGKDHPFYGKKRNSEIYDKVVEIRRANGSYIGVGNFAPKKVKNIEDGKIFDSIQEAADYYELTRDQVGHSCRKETKRGKFRFV